MAFGLTEIASAVGIAGGIKDLFGGGGGNSRSRDYRIAKEFATHSIDWKVNDAKRAGIHPLYALGAAPSMGPSSVVGQSDSGSGLQQISEGLANYSATKYDQKRQAALDTASLAESKARILESTSRSTLDLVQAQQISSAGKTLAARNNAQKDLKATTITTPGGKFKTSKTTTAEDVQREYGGVAEEAYGIWRLLNDGIENYQGQMKQTRKPQRGYQIRSPNGP